MAAMLTSGPYKNASYTEAGRIYERVRSVVSLAGMILTVLFRDWTPRSAAGRLSLEEPAADRSAPSADTKQMRRRGSAY